jgi:hypothetical protein
MIRPRRRAPQGAAPPSSFLAEQAGGQSGCIRVPVSTARQPRRRPRLRSTAPGAPWWLQRWRRRWIMGARHPVRLACRVSLVLRWTGTAAQCGTAGATVSVSGRRYLRPRAPHARAAQRFSRTPTTSPGDRGQPSVGLSSDRPRRLASRVLDARWGQHRGGWGRGWRSARVTSGGPAGSTSCWQPGPGFRADIGLSRGLGLDRDLQGEAVWGQLDESDCFDVDPDDDLRLRPA